MHLDLRRGILLPHLRAWRLVRLLTQVELAERVHVSRDTIIAAEHGRPLRLPTVARIAKTLRVTREQLAYGPPPAERR